MFDQTSDVCLLICLETVSDTSGDVEMSQMWNLPLIYLMTAHFTLYLRHVNTFVKSKVVSYLGGPYL